MKMSRPYCRVCEKSTKTVAKLGSYFMNAFVDKPKDRTQKVPIELALCKPCKLLQLRHTAPFQEMYINQYWYKSGINPVIVDDLEHIVKQGLSISKKKKGNWIDIGANDGTLLKFVPEGWMRVGVEPAKNLEKELEKNCERTYVELWEDVLDEAADVITAIGMFYDTDEPNTFIANVKRHLKPDGIFIAQMMTLYPMVQNADIGNICHEHLLFFSYTSLKRLFERNGLEIFKVDRNGINGGSYRLYARHLKQGSIDFVDPDIDHKKFIRKINENKRRTVAFINKVHKQGKKVYIYGASTKGNMIAQYYGMDSKLIKGAADRNEAKWGKYMVGSGIPIVSEEEARKEADYFWVMPYGFFKYFQKREKDWVKKGGKFILNAPEFKVV